MNFFILQCSYYGTIELFNPYISIARTTAWSLSDALAWCKYIFQSKSGHIVQCFAAVHLHVNAVHLSSSMYVFITLLRCVKWIEMMDDNLHVGITVVIDPNHSMQWTYLVMNMICSCQRQYYRYDAAWANKFLRTIILCVW